MCRERTREDKKRDREEDEEDVYERRRLERRLRDKEAAYQEVRVTSHTCHVFICANSVMVKLFSHILLKRLKNWEIRERKKARDYSKEMEREDERRREMVHK